MEKAAHRSRSPALDLRGAAGVLEQLAAGRVPDRAALAAASLALSQAGAEPDLVDAATGLEILATGRPFQLDAAARDSAAKLAALVLARAEAGRPQHCDGLEIPSAGEEPGRDAG